MGIFGYNGSIRVEFDDRALAHVQLVIGAKLRRDESFYFSWEKSAPAAGRTTVWIDRHIPLTFDFEIVQMPQISPEWIEQLNRTAHSPGGLRIVPNPADPDLPLTGGGLHFDADRAGALA